MNDTEVGKYISVQAEKIGKTIEADTPSQWRAVVVVISTDGKLIFGAAGVAPSDLRAILRAAADSAEENPEDLYQGDFRPN